MNKDKVIVGLAGMILCFVALSWGQMKEEISLISQNEIIFVAESLQVNYFTPLSLAQQVKWHREFAEKLEEAQGILDRSWIAKYIVNFKEQIAEEKRQVSVLEEAGGDEVTFMTRNMHTVISIPEFTQEELFQIGALIDELFNEEVGHAYFTVGMKYGKRQILSQPLQEAVSGKYSEFVHRVSQEVFDGEPVLFVLLNHEHPNESDFYES
jgi:hypothetical protein